MPVASRVQHFQINLVSSPFIYWILMLTTVSQDLKVILRSVRQRKTLFSSCLILLMDLKSLLHPAWIFLTCGLLVAASPAGLALLPSHAVPLQSSDVTDLQWVRQRLHMQQWKRDRNRIKTSYSHLPSARCSASPACLLWSVGLFIWPTCHFLYGRHQFSMREMLKCKISGSVRCNISWFYSQPRFSQHNSNATPISDQISRLISSRRIFLTFPKPRNNLPEEIKLPGSVTPFESFFK